MVYLKAGRKASQTVDVLALQKAYLRGKLMARWTVGEMAAVTVQTTAASRAVPKERGKDSTSAEPSAAPKEAQSAGPTALA